MTTFGRNIIDSTGVAVQVCADGAPEFKTGGITIDWSTVSAEGSERTLADGTVIRAGAKGLAFGTVLALIGVAEVQTITITATGGTYTLTGNGETTAALAYNANAATIQTAVRGLGGVYSNVVVTGAGPFTVTFPLALGNVAALVVDAAAATGGTVSLSTSTAGGGDGRYGPFASNATDGRQTLRRGQAFVLNESLLESDDVSNHPGVLEGGRMWRARLKIGSEANPTSIGGNNPSVSDFNSAFPRATFVE